MDDLYVIVLAGSGRPVWAAVCDQERAEQAAIAAAVNGGMVHLLSGRELAQHLNQEEYA